MLISAKAFGDVSGDGARRISKLIAESVICLDCSGGSHCMDCFSQLIRQLPNHEFFKPTRDHALDKARTVPQGSWPKPQAFTHPSTQAPYARPHRLPLVQYREAS